MHSINAQPVRGRSALSWTLLMALLLALILVPFWLFEEDMNRWVSELTRTAGRRSAVAAAILLLLGADVLLPVPSSIVSTGAGATLGFVPGLLASTAGMTLGSLAGYALGRKFGLSLVRRMIDEHDIDRVSARFRRGAVWALAAMRGIPVLAEASCMIAGVLRVPLPLYASVTTLANAGISAVYCAVGARALETGSFLLAFAASLALPGIAILIARMLRPRSL